MPNTSQADTTYAPTNARLAACVAHAETRYPSVQDCARIHRGAALVERGSVSIRDGVWHVESNCHIYALPHGKCSCIDALPFNAGGRALSSRCKHRWAVALAKAIARAERAAKPAPRSMVFVASLGDPPAQRHGIAVIFEDGACWFQEYGAMPDKVEPVDFPALVLGHKKTWTELEAQNIARVLQDA